MLAVLGGHPVRQSGWPEWPQWDERTLEQLKSVLESRRWAISWKWLGQTTKEQEFARRFAAYNRVPYCTPVDHGSSGLVAALEALDVGPGDEVIVPALTWVATAIAVCDVNAVPVLVDVDPETYCISVEEVERAITPRTRAIIPVHLYGCMADMDRLMALARERGLYVVEDASHSHGSIWSGQFAGTIGDIGVFSLQQGKVLTAGEGGAVLTRSRRLFERLEELRSNSRRLIPEDRVTYGEMQLEESGEIMGTNWCLSEFQAAVLLDQLERLEAQNVHKEQNAAYLDSRLAEVPGVRPMRRLPQVDRQAYYRYVVRIDPAQFADLPLRTICQALQAELGFGVEPPYKPIHRSPLFRPRTKRRYHISDEHWQRLDFTGCSFPVAERAATVEGVSFHHSVLLADRSDMDDIVRAFEKVQKYAHLLREPSLTA